MHVCGKSNPLSLKPHLTHDLRSQLTLGGVDAAVRSCKA